MNPFLTILLSLLGGVLPALFWLWFWLKEDRLHPEPRSKIMLVFLLGMVSVFLVLPVEKFIYAEMLSNISLLTILLWATTEETFKYAFAYFGALRTKETDEPIDAVIYMVTAALGFSAIENTLFITKLIDVGSFLETAITGNSRFIGATLLHVASSAAIGVALALGFYKRPLIKKILLFTGIIFSILLHTIFNLLIINFDNKTFLIFSGVWVLIIVLIVLIEKVKKINH